MPLKRIRSWLLCVLGPACLAACAGNGLGLDQGGRPLPPGGTSGGALSADFDSIQQNVFTPICTTCHAGSNAPQGLHLDAANSYSQLLGVASVEVPSLLRVKAGDPDNSYIIQKLEGHAAVGAQMPFGGPPLAASTIAFIRQWIGDGALRSPTPTGAAVRFAATSVVPAPGDVLDGPPVRIIIAFSQDLDLTQIDANSVHLEAVSEDGEPAARLRATLAVPPGNLRALIVTPVRPLLGGRHYRLVVGGLSGSGVSSVNGEQLFDSLAHQGEEALVTEFDVAVQP